MDSGFTVTRVSAALGQPIFADAPAGDGERLFVADRAGAVFILDRATGEVAQTPFLDLFDEVSTGGERGLLGLAFSPDFASDGTFYVHLSNADGDTEVRRYTVSADDPDRADPDSGDVILRVEQPFSNHNGGFLGFGPEGLLHLALGDGGGSLPNSDDNPAQDPGSLLGKVLRLDVSGDDFPDDPLRDYAIPAGNPFAEGGGAPEVWALGLRNPFRASFDPATGDLFIGDVGEGRLEEVDILPAGQGGLNFGWNAFEGTLDFRQTANVPEGAAFTPPVLEFEHGGGPLQGNSVTGGVVHRGPIEALRGEFVFGDFVSGNIWSVPAERLTAAREAGETLTGADFTLRNDQIAPDAGSIDLISSFGTDADGNLYITDLDGEIFRVDPVSGDPLDLPNDFTVAQQVAAVYIGYFGRAPDPAGFEFWIGEYQRGLSDGKAAATVLRDIAESFRFSEEAISLFPVLDPAAPDADDSVAIDAFVADLFDNLFGRPPDSAGAAFWVEEIQDRLGEGTAIGHVIIDIMSGARDGTTRDVDADGVDEVLNDAAVLGNKIEVADVFGARIGGAFTDGEARRITDDVGADPASAIAALDRIDVLVGAAAQSADVAEDLF